MKIEVITIFPGLVEAVLGESMMKRAAAAGQVAFHCINPRDFTTDPHRTVDDRPYGGGPGMVMKPDPLFAAVESVWQPNSKVILMTPQGTRFTQSCAEQLALESHLIFLCGHYEGIDERVRSELVDMELSIGDYVLTNGAVPAAVVIDAVVRLLPGVLGAGEAGIREESFSSGLLDYPQYTRPEEFRGLRVPEVLRSGDHARVAQWRREQALQRTREKRPDLLSDG